MTITGLVISGGLGLVMSKVAKKQGMCPVIWGVGTFISPFIGIPAYLAVAHKENIKSFLRDKGILTNKY